ncbi:MAG: DUF6531 domain-containing protein [Chitinophagaceae bacterium]
MSDKIDINRKIQQAAEKGAKAGEQASATAVGQIVSTAGAAMGVYGTVMGATSGLSEKALMPVMQALSFMQGIACLPASSHMDPVMGIDVHFVMIPPSPSPIPMPHPYIAMVMDPKDWISCAVMTVAAMAAPEPTGNADADAAASLAFSIGMMALGMAGLGATVKLGSLTPRTTSGTKNKPIPHFPMGASFAPVPVLKNAGHAQFGSLFLTADNNPFTGLMHLNNDCWDIGIMQLMRKKAPPEAMHLFMPTGFIMAIPSHNVIVNPVPTPINPIAALTKLLNAGFAKLLHGIVNKLPFAGRVANMLSKAICHVTGHPVDVVSGSLFTDEEDFSLPGVIPLSWERTWYSDSVHKGSLGYGWYHNYDMGFFIDEFNHGIYRMNDGRPAVFELPEPGKSTFNRTEKLFLHCHATDNYYYVTDKEGLQYRFTSKKYTTAYGKGEEHFLQSISNANGYAIRFEYNRSGALHKITDSAGRILTVEHDFEGRIAQITAPHPTETGKTFVITKYEYDDEGNMICQTDALGQKMLFEYENHLLVKETWRDGQQWYFLFDGKATGARCIHTWGDGDLYNHRLTYNQGQTIVENSLGHTTIYNHRHNLLHSKIDGNGAEWKYRYNRFNDLEWETDPLGNQQSYTHDEWGNLSTTTDPAGGFTFTEYYNMQYPFLPTEAMDAAGGKWLWEYDERGNLVERVNPLKAKTEYQYDDGLLKEIISATGAVTTLRYDLEQNLTRIQTDDGAVTQYSYDVLGNCTMVTNPNDRLQKRWYDLKARVSKVADFDSNNIVLEYDGIDNVIRYRDNQKNVQYTYHGLWKLTSRTEANATIYFNYDTEEQLRKIINEHGLPYRFELDPVGNVTEEIGFDAIARQYERNEAGWVTQLLQPSGKFTRYCYDKCGRVTEVFYSDSKKKSYDYRPSGELIAATNEYAKVTLERDVMGNIIKETSNDAWIVSEFDLVSNRIKTKSSFGAEIHQQYSVTGDILQTTANGWLAKFEYDKLGLEKMRLLPGGISSQWQRDGIGRPIVQTTGHSSANSAIVHKKRQYVWDVNDRLKQVKDEHGTTSFEYDTLSNLTKTIYANGEAQLRNPDAVGNLYQTERRTDRKYDKGGRLKKNNDWEYEYNIEGNLIKKYKAGSEDAWIYEWNGAGMLTKVIRPDNEEVLFTYDALGRRLSKRYKNTITKFIWDGNVILHEWKEHAQTGDVLAETVVNANGSIQGMTTWIFDKDSFAPCAKIKADKNYSIVTDHLGTPSQMYKDDGSLFWDCHLDSYGKVRMEKGDAGSCPFRYQGQYEDCETGLYYNRFRYYAVDDGVYLSSDRIGLDGGMKLYSYVHDPNAWVDVFGLSSYSDTRRIRKHAKDARKEAKLSKKQLASVQRSKDRAARARTDATRDKHLTRAATKEKMYMGTQVDTIFKDKVRNDPSLAHLEVTPPGKFGPDVTNPQTGEWHDCTTQTDWDKGTHQEKYGENGKGAIWD